MAFSYTGVAYSLAFLSVGLLSYRFFQYWQREKTTLSKLFFYFTGSLSFFMLVTAIAGLFFAKNIQVLRSVVVSAVFIQTIASSIVCYLLIYMKLPRVSPWAGFIVFFLLGSVGTILTAVTPFYPHLELNGGINWDYQPISIIFRSFVFLTAFIPLIVILIQQIRTSKDPFVKTKALGLGIIMVFGTFVAVFSFFLENILKLGAISSDITLGVLSGIVFIVVFISQKPPVPKIEEKYIPSSSQIPW